VSELPIKPLSEAATRAQAAVRAQAMVKGKIRVPPMRCGVCKSPSIKADDGDPKRGITPRSNILICLSCGRETPVDVARRIRRQEIRAVLEGRL
jgi:hypothetical protein